MIHDMRARYDSRDHSKKDLELLCELLASGLAMVEVGSCNGESMEVFAQSGKFRSIGCVDPWVGLVSEQSFDERMNLLQNDRLKIAKYKMFSIDAASHFEAGSLDLVYIDADHTYEGVKQDILLWMPKLKPSGILSGHDYNGQYRGVGKSVHEMLGVPDRILHDITWVKWV